MLRTGKVVIGLMVASLMLFGLGGVSFAQPTTPEEAISLIEERVKAETDLSTSEVEDLISELKARLTDTEAVDVETILAIIEGCVDKFERATPADIAEIAALANELATIGEGLAEGRDVSEALEAVEGVITTHTEVLTDLLDEVPEQAKEAIERAIEVSQRGQERALEALEETKREAVERKREAVERKAEEREAALERAEERMEAALERAEEHMEKAEDYIEEGYDRWGR